MDLLVIHLSLHQQFKGLAAEILCRAMSIFITVTHTNKKSSAKCVGFLRQMTPPSPRVFATVANFRQLFANSIFHGNAATFRKSNACWNNRRYAPLSSWRMLVEGNPG